MGVGVWLASHELTTFAKSSESLKNCNSSFPTPYVSASSGGGGSCLGAPTRRKTQEEVSQPPLAQQTHHYGYIFSDRARCSTRSTEARSVGQFRPGQTSAEMSFRP